MPPPPPPAPGPDSVSEPRLAPPPRRTSAGESDRARERLLDASARELRDADVLGVLLGTGAPGTPAADLADEILGASGGLRTLLRRTPAELAALPGVGEARAARLLACAEIGRRVAEETLPRGRLFLSSRQVFQHYGPRLRDLRVEQLRALYLDGKHRVLREELVSQGTLTSSPVHPREVFGPAMRHAAAAVVLVHNHPSGDPSPSEDDVAITRRLTHASELLGIRVLDHVIVGDGTYASFKERGLL